MANVNIQIPANLNAMTNLVATNQANSDALNVTQRYSDQNSLLLLLERLGCGVRERFRILHNGFNSAEAIIDHYGSDMEALAKQLRADNKSWASASQNMMRSFFSPVVITRLVGAFHYIGVGVKLLHKIPDINRITIARSVSYHTLYKDLDPDNDDDAADNVNIPAFTEVKGWMNFKENLLLSLGLTKGARNIPLIYVVDDTTRTVTDPTTARTAVDEYNLDEDGLLRKNVVHFGDEYKLDNKTVWNKLHSLLVETAPYNHISSYARTKNGRGAWQALVTFYEGEDFRQNQRETAFMKLQSTFYRGETNRFNFEKYVSIHKYCHKMLEDAQFNNGSGLDDESKMTYFRNGIQSVADLDIPLSNSRTNGRGNTFDTLVSYLSAEVNHNSLRKKQLKSAINKTVSAVERNKGKNNNSSGKGGKGKGKGNKVPSEVVDGKRVEGRWYSPQEFSKMTGPQRTAIIKLKRQANNSKGGDNQINVSSIRSDIQSDLVTVGEAIIAGVRQASADNDDGSHSGETTPSSNSSLGTRTSAEAGSIGNIFRNRKRRKGGK